MAPTLIIRRGNVGNGKTHGARLLERIGFVAIAADDYPGLYDQNGFIDLTKLAAAHSWCRHQVEALMRDRRDIVLHNTNMTKGYLQPWLDLAKAQKYRVNIEHCEAAIDEFGEVYQNTHNVPDHIRRKFAAKFEPFV